MKLENSNISSNNFFFGNNLLQKKNINFIKNKLKLYKNSINKKENFFNLFKKNINIKKNKFKKYQKFNQIYIIGMGGSILGSEAIYNFLNFKIKKKVKFINNLDKNYLVKLKKQFSKKTLFILISKSGNTLETLTNINFFAKYINKNNSIIITENKNNSLQNFSKDKNILFIEHKPFFGGRFSVLSEVGIVPCILFNLNVSNFKKNAQDYFAKKKMSYLIKNANSMSEIYRNKKINSIVLLNYVPELEKFLFWLQQLLSESLGKKGRGLLPVVSNAPKDHHSLLQLYLDGPKDKIFYIFESKRKKISDLKINSFNKTASYLNKKNYHQIIESQKKAIIQTFKNKKIRFRSFVLKKHNEQTLGELFCYFILETILIGNLAHINPYSQPAVEQVKIKTRRILIK